METFPWHRLAELPRAGQSCSRVSVEPKISRILAQHRALAQTKQREVEGMGQRRARGGGDWLGFRPSWRGVRRGKLPSEDDRAPVFFLCSPTLSIFESVQ